MKRLPPENPGNSRVLPPKFPVTPICLHQGFEQPPPPKYYPLDQFQEIWEASRGGSLPYCFFFFQLSVYFQDLTIPRTQMEDNSAN